MKILRNLKQIAALSLLRGNMNPKQDEFCWFKSHSDYLIQHGRKYIYEVKIDTNDIRELITSDSRGDKQKVAQRIEEIKKNSYPDDSYIFIRDLNNDETGSFYVEDGVHRTQALQELLKQDSEVKREIKAVLFSKKELRRELKYTKINANT